MSFPFKASSAKMICSLILFLLVPGLYGALSNYIGMHLQMDKVIISQEKDGDCY